MTPIASAIPVSDLSPASDRLLAALREHALIIGRVTLSSGAEAEYYVDAKRATLLPGGFAAMGELVAAKAAETGATAVGGMTMGADPVACAALAAGADVKAFFVRKDVKAHGLQRGIEGPLLDPETDRCLIVEDVVTTGSATLAAIDRRQGGRPADRRRRQRARSPGRRRRGDRTGVRGALHAPDDHR